MTEPSDPAQDADLPPFSFSKRPIISTMATSAIPHNIDRALLNVLKPADVPTFNNVNYDDRIRAPRMSLATHYTYKPELPRPESSEHNVDGSSQAGPTTPGCGNEDAQLEYRPATADLNQPTRRNLEPIKQKWGILVSTGNILSLDTVEYPEIYGTAAKFRSGSGALPGTTPLMQQKLVRAIENLDANTTLEERAAHAERANSFCKPASGRNRVYMPSSGPAIQQVYTQKKPLCLPAVLRPPQEIDKINEEDFLHDLSADEGSFEAKLGEFPFEMPQDATLQNSRAEPTHEHWAPNSSSDHCMNCFEVFRGFFNPQRRGRHHCRFCGLLYCHNCLYKSREAFQIAPPAADTQTQLRANSGSSNSSSKFKLCKVCKTCGNNSLRLLYLLNQRSRAKNDIDTPYVFIDNPYIGASHALQAHPLYDLKSRATRPGFKNEGGSERRASYNHVPSDWTWSSF
ncbi:hypothetical protein METBIDRAFT_45193 [Metschnikowia bicuspidata var. bicuspidata NRRL YB-4993]|uniref:FYVE-type domain-containing protein n=1 Tax=Metschnikowia bicuspidata var. bicuspidata NRRL YB-4993 TaxID=869754 RepID=A0A1A0H6Z2_9ASCO|nr:hypothetical protein METBIDRAFT_45193 [Metschnikowia bicuspidata var. bicuspidata NRRL YB-4993]OBA19725.1 hypothetical protein METBIDRAFT_45193 [Metschnikowia bicuspidata var. bicuspidata NRRL YB-4993]